MRNGRRFVSIRGLRGALGHGALVLVILVSLDFSASMGRAQGQTTTTAQSLPTRHVTTEPGQSATLLPDGRWLLIGGTVQGEPQSTISISNGMTVQPFPVSLDVARAGHTATVLPDGTVLVAGGAGVDGQLVSEAEDINTAAGTVQPLMIMGLEPRTEGTATLLTDGRVLFVGGLNSSGQPIATAQLWGPRTNSLDTVAPALQYPRYGQNATLLPDGMVEVSGGKTTIAGESPPPEEYNSSTQLFEPAYGSTQTASSTVLASPGLAASAPASGALDVPVDSPVALRFETPVNVTQLNSSTVTLIGPTGAVSGQVVGAEGGRLAFFTPSIDLVPDTTYTLFVNGVTDASGMPVPFSSVHFTTHRFANASSASSTVNMARPSTGSASRDTTSKVTPGARAAQTNRAVAGNLAETTHRPPAIRQTQQQAASVTEDWLPQEANRHGQWRVLGLSGDPPLDPAASSIVDLSAPDGTTAIAGHVLRLNGKPLAGVVVSASGENTTTDASGRFLLSGIGAGVQMLKVDGTGVVSSGRHYTVHYIRVNAVDGATTSLSAPIYLPRVDPATEVTISSPADHDIVLTHPAIPGLEVIIPEGTVIRTFDGKIVTKVSITPVPVDRPPYPTPVPFTTYFTLQPGGAYVDGDTSKAIKVIYPNYQGLRPGATADLWNYDPASGGWKLYGHGKVSKDGKQVIPDESAGFHQIMSFGLGIGNNTEPNPGPTPNGCNAADPVDCGSGLFSHTVTDLIVNDVIPISVTRLYRTNDNVSREFGVGANLSYAMWLSTTNANNGATLIRGDGSRINFTPISGSGAPYHNTDSPTEFLGSTLVLDTTTDLWHLTLRDGTVYTFYNAYYPNQLISIADRNGNTVTLTVQTNSSCGTGNPLPITQVTSPNGRYIQFTYDTSCRITQAVDNTGRSVSYTYDSAGHLQKATDADNNSEIYAYDPTTNNMNSITDKRGNTEVQIVYDANGRVQQQTLADGAVWKFAYTLNANGNVTQTTVTDPRNYVRQMTFNASGYPTQIVLAQGQPEQQTFTMTLGTNNLVSTITDQLGRQTQYNYDSYGDVTSVVQLAGTSSAVSYGFGYDPTYRQLTSYTDPLSHVTSIGLDARGNVASITDALGHSTTIMNNGEGLPTQIEDALGHTANIGYTGADLASVTNGLGSTTSIFTDDLGRIEFVTDPLGNRRQFTYDDMDRITSVLDPLGGNTKLAYDQNGNLLTVTDPRGVASHEFTYDARNRVHTYTDPDGNTTTYTWDGMGNLLSKLDAKGQLTSYSYDGINRPTKITYADGSTIQITWDGGNRATTFADSANGTITRTFDGLDRLTQETSPQGQVSYEYDAAGRRTQLTVSGQSQPITYGYDNANRLTSITQGSVAAVELGYDNANRRTNVTLPNGIVGTFGFDNANELTSISYDHASTHVGDLAYSYDPTGRRTATSGSLASLLMPSNPAGSLAAWASATYTWNARDQLVGTSWGSSTFSYDALGRRTSKTVAGTTTTYLHDGSNPVLVNGALMLSGLGLDEYYGRVASGGAVTSLLTDALGSTLALTNSAGTTTAIYSYGVYGNAVSTGSDSTPFQFTGRENDGNAYLYYYRARYYNPTFGRFISADPVGLLGGINPYAYAGDNPISNRDPLGLWSLGEPLPEQWFNYSVGVADAASFGLGWYVRSFTKYADEVDTCSTAYKAGLWSGAAVQAGIGTGAVAAVQGVKSTAQALYIASQLLTGTGDLTGATAVGSETVEALYTAGEVQADSDIDALQNAIKAASALRSTTPAMW